MNWEPQTSGWKIQVAFTGFVLRYRGIVCGRIGQTLPCQTPYMGVFGEETAGRKILSGVWPPTAPVAPRRGANG